MPRRLISPARHYATRLGVLLTRGQPHIFEIFAAGTAAIWATVLALPADTLGSSPGFRVLGTVGLSEEGIALLFGLLALTQGLALLRDDLPGRIWAALFGWACWAFLAGTLILGNPVAPGGWMYLWLALGQFWTAIRLGRSRPWTRRSSS
jgi:hypothetical protein